jgi:sucrose-6-phosphate hydrolase SacC (GH32 family)
MKATLFFAIAFLSFQAFSQTIEKTYKIEKRYLNFPVENSQDRIKMDMTLEGESLMYSVIRLCENEPDYWVFKDVSKYIGKTLKISYAKNVKGINLIQQTDKFIGEDIVYKEINRPQIHFTSKRGWNNDPNGLVWHNGEFHLYYQHNPFEANWENMHWGHAVSKDLVYWEELNDALYPDELGTMFSGSAVIDINNTAGWGKSTLVAAYTAAGKVATQCIAYSTDNGRTFTKYEGNPVINTMESEQKTVARDPKVFWYAPGKHWVMALYEDNFISIYTSNNLKDWKHESKTLGFFECPELFELAVDGDTRSKKWIMYGASGTYMIGSFDGKKFTPESGKHFYSRGSQYAAQTFNNVPDGRRIQIGWGRITHKDMPFKSMMLFPMEMTLETTPDGIRIKCNPINEIEKLHEKSYKWSNISGKEANKKLADIKSDYLHINFDIELVKDFNFDLKYKGNKILSFDGNWNNYNGTPYSGDVLAPFRHKVELIIDKTSFEGYIGGGRLFISEQLKDAKTIEGLEFSGNMKVHNLEIYELKSIWNN